MVHYVGILDGAGKVWGIRFPDIPGCVGAGSTPEQAIADATIALRDVIAYKRQKGFEPPKAKPISEVLASAEIDPGETAILIPVILDAGRTIRANLTLDAGLLAAIDSEAKRRGLTRSAFLASAAREKLEARGK
ncbi:MAG: type II toxin-antitoxin system HicB family antitoxin [Rhodomicrobium sp.]